jgi:hypothetical protein
MRTFFLATTALGAALMASGATAASCIGTFNYSGSIQTCTIDLAGTYALAAFGAQGGGFTGGLGAQAGGTVALSAGDILSILVGGRGGTTNSIHGQLGHGGGGGTFLALSGTTPLVVAGGGGGGNMSGTAGGAGRAETSGGNGTGNFINGQGGTGGSGGGYATLLSSLGSSYGGGGGGWSGDGAGSAPGAGGGKSFLAGGAGGAKGSSITGDLPAPGGFGGGGGSQLAAGGGGYSGGGSGSSGGGGGGSFLADTITDDLLAGGVRAGDGLVTIRLLDAVVPPSVPEPGSLLLVAAAGLAGLVARRRR